MAKTIIQKVVFKNTKTKQLYDLYMNAKLHALITAGPVKISQKIGSKIDVFSGYITGKTLQIVKDALIVQQWRGSDWGKKDSDSVFVLSFEQKGKDAIMNVVHANIPDSKVAGISKGWYGHYWNPWKQYLTGKEIVRPKN